MVDGRERTKIVRLLSPSWFDISVVTLEDDVDDEGDVFFMIREWNLISICQLVKSFLVVVA